MHILLGAIAAIVLCLSWILLRLEMWGWQQELLLILHYSQSPSNSQNHDRQQASSLFHHLTIN